MHRIFRILSGRSYLQIIKSWGFELMGYRVVYSAGLPVFKSVFIDARRCLLPIAVPKGSCGYS